MIALWLASAWAGGIGMVVELSPGAAWSNSRGPLIRGNAIRLDTGVFFGPYQGTLQYGRYTRIGLQMGARVAPVLQSGDLETVVVVAPEIGRGVDLLKVGAFWKLALGPIVRVPTVNPELDDLEWGAVGRGTVGGVYWLNRNLGIVGRFEGGAEYVEGGGQAVVGGIGLGLMGRVGVRTGYDDEDEDEDASDAGASAE